MYSFPIGRAPVFHPTPAPTDDDVAAIAGAVFRKVDRTLRRFTPSSAQQRFVEDAPLLLGMAAASSQGVIATGPRRGRRVIRVRGATKDVDAFVMGRLCAQVEGYNLQAATRIAANDREGLERLGRYLARPPIATERLGELPDGRLELRLKRPWRDGTTSLIFTAQELLEKLCTLVPRPRVHVTRYFGVLAPAFVGRSLIVPGGASPVQSGRPPAPPGAEAPAGPGRFPWASLIWRVFLKDVLSCERCAGRMQIVAAVTAPAAIARVLKHLGLSGEIPTFHPARPPPQTEWRWCDDSAGFDADPPAPEDVTA